jgi:GT2 family glycosyltransferase
MVLTAESVSGWPESVSQEIPVGEATTRGYVTQLPPHVRSLRIALPTGPERFALSDVRIVELGRGRLLLALLRRCAQGGTDLCRVLHRAPRILLRRGPGGLRQALYTAAKAHGNYRDWVSLYDRFDEGDRQIVAEQLARLALRPRFTVVTPVSPGGLGHLRATARSVLDQVYPHWSYSIVPVGSIPDIAAHLPEQRAPDPRARIIDDPIVSSRSAALNTAVDRSVDDLVCILEPGDRLRPHTLASIAAELSRHPDADIVYADEDRIDVRGQRFDPWLKTDWNPDLMLEADAIGRAAFIRRHLIERAGGFRSAFDPAALYDLSLRAATLCLPDAIRHVPHVLYHRLADPDGPDRVRADAAAEARARCRAAAEHLRPHDAKVTVDAAQPSAGCIVRFPMPGSQPLVSIIIPTRDKLRLLRRCVRSVLAQTRYSNFDLLIVDNRSEKYATLRYLRRISRDPRVSVIEYDAPYNFAAMNNEAVRHTRGDLLVFLNNDIEVISGDWLSEMARQALRPETGAVGAMLYYPDDTVQHAGVLVGQNGPADHAHKGLDRASGGYRGLARRVQNFSAVTAACMMIRRETFEAAGGFDAERFAVAFNDVDLCLRLWEAGYRTVWTPRARLYHHESASLGMPHSRRRSARTSKETEAFIARWRERLLDDPFHNPSFSRSGAGFDLAFPPPSPHHWRDLGGHGDHGALRRRAARPSNQDY